MAREEDRIAEASDVLRFSHDDAIELGRSALERMRGDGLIGAVLVVRGDQRVFQAALAGTSHDIDLWLDRKVRVARTYDAASYAVKRTFLARGQDFAADSLHDPRELMAAGGAVPVRIGGAPVGVIALSGWHEEGEHALAAELVTALAAAQASAGGAR